MLAGPIYTKIFTLMSVQPISKIVYIPFIDAVHFFEHLGHNPLHSIPIKREVDFSCKEKYLTLGINFLIGLCVFMVIYANSVLL